MDEHSLAQLSSAQWRGGAFDADQVAMAVVTAWCARAADLVLAAPTRRDVRPDAIVTDLDQNWMIPIIVNGVARDEFTVSKDLLGSGVALVWVFLGAPDGGLPSHSRTEIVVLDPATAWELPAKIGEQAPDGRSSYHWPSVPAVLRDELAEHTATSPEELRALLGQHAWRKPGLSVSSS
ncbi:hypothetical protein [Nocardia sp. NPDC003963]